jgi:hypothetical protein
MSPVLSVFSKRFGYVRTLTDLELTDDTDTSKISNLETEFKKLISDYSVAVLPE